MDVYEKLCLPFARFTRNRKVSRVFSGVRASRKYNTADPLRRRFRLTFRNRHRCRIFSVTLRVTYDGRERDSWWWVHLTPSLKRRGSADCQLLANSIRAIRLSVGTFSSASCRTSNSGHPTHSQSSLNSVKARADRKLISFLFR